MGFLSGPSKYVTVRMAQGVAAVALQLRFVRELAMEDRETMLNGMRSEGAPTSMEELISLAASVITEHNMGWWRKSQYLAVIRATLIGGGMSEADAAYFTGLVELDNGTPLHEAQRPRAQVSPARSEPEPRKPQQPAREAEAADPIKSPGQEAGSEAELSRAAARAKEPVADQPVSPEERYGFKANEFVVYPAHGVGQILAIEEQAIAGAKLELFVINFVKDKMTLRVPASKVANVGMRKLSEPALVKKALETLKGRARFEDELWSLRAEKYEAKINSGDIVSIAEVVRDLYRSESQPEQSYSERQLYEAALDRLSREIAVVQHSTDAEAVKEIVAQLAKSPRRASTTAETTQDAEALRGRSSDKQASRKANPMRVDFSEWYTRPGFVARKYTYSQMGDTRDTELEVHFNIQAGLSVFTFVNFIISDLDLTSETALRGSLRPMDGSGPKVILNMMGRPDGARNVVMGVSGRDDAGRCLRAFLDGKNMHFEIDTSDGEPLIRLPLRNDGVFETLYREARDKVQATDDASLVSGQFAPRG